MDAAEFRVRGKEMVDYIADYLETIHERRVFPEVDPGYLEELIPNAAPEKPESWDDIIKDIERVIMPGMVHWQHPGFHAYFPAGNSFPSIMADMLGDGLGCVGFSWASSPACTELETVMLDWMGRMLQLPKDFLFSESGGKGGGVLQGSASDCILVALLSARSNCLKELREENPCSEDGEFLSKMVAYCSKQAHSSMEKASMIASVQIRQLPTDSDFSLRGDTLKNAIERDREVGLIPIFVGATLGTTASCAFDNVEELGLICHKEQLWLHVDGAYAGNAMICPEFRHLLDGIEHASSFNINPNKWMLVNFDCSCMWVKDSNSIKSAFNVDPLYLQHKNTGSCIDYRHWGIPLSRRFRSLKLWFVIRSYGVEALRNYIRRHCKLAKKFEHLMKQDSRFELMNKVVMGLVCFRMIGPNRFCEVLLQNINESGRLHMVPSSLNGKYMIRFALCAEHANEADITYAWKVIQQFADQILHPSELDDEHLLEQPGPNGEVVDSKAMKRLNLKPLDLGTDTVIIEEGAPFCPVSELMIGPFRGRTKKLRQTQSLHLW
ncbi:aromatic-L-amino-acid decarboxylase-like [Convolutriloba macropyga]|uniref:aromatic-L-amino-acid decarboxylase-like n=1 Tax=Convolutriloba macropyga TaxID=536237 RepID=UPI003F51BAF2